MNKINVITIGFVAAALICATGCVSRENIQLRSQVAADQQQITELQGRLAQSEASKATGNLAEAGSEAFTASKSAFAWLSAHTVSAYHTTSEKFHACFDGQKKPETFEAAKDLAVRCWNAE